MATIETRGKAPVHPEAGESPAGQRRRLRSAGAIVLGVLILLLVAMPQNLVALLDRGGTDPVSRTALEAARGIEGLLSRVGTPQLYEDLRARFQRLRQS